MSFYTGSIDKDGNQLVREFEGFHVSPDGKLWGSKPIDNDGNFLDEAPKHLEKQEIIPKYFL